LMPDKHPRVWATVPEDYKKAVAHLVESGAYLTEPAVVRAGLRMIFAYHGLEIPYGEITYNARAQS